MNAALEQRRRTEGLVALVVAQIAFGGFPIFVKLSVDGGAGFSPRAIVVWRIVGAALILTLIALLRHRKAFWPARSDWSRLFACSLFGIVVNQICAVEGTSRTRAIHAAMLFTTIPIFTYAVALVARQERMSLRRASGIVLALAGAMLLVLGRFDEVGGEPASAPVFGGFLIVVNCLSYAVFLVIARPLLARLPTLVVLMWAFLLSLWIVPVLVYWNGGTPLWLPEASTRALVGMVSIVLVSTILGYLINTYALARVSASTTAVFVYVQPLFAIVAAWLVLGEGVGLDVVLSAALLFSGIALVVRRVDRRAA